MRSPWYLKLFGFVSWCLVTLGIIFYFYFFQFRPPVAFPAGMVVSVTNGNSLSAVAEDLKSEQIIRSPFWFTNFVLLLKRETRVVGGDYYFEEPMNVYEVAKRVTRGSFGTEQIKTTIPEGSSVREIAAIVKKNYPEFDEARFIAIASSSEGYLFPDTYIFGGNVKPEKIVDVMRATFDKKIVEPDIAQAIEDYGRPVDEVLKMASILEGEARQMRTRQIVAGILWERIRLGIPLQVDASFKYINGKGSADLTLDDLKIDSPYNSYVYKGLPPTPISSPGLDSIMAAVTPIPTKYLYFLTDNEGNMHYAETLEKHAANKKKYLK